MENNIQPLTLFGGDIGWNSLDWEAVDDRVRGGSSQSYIECSLTTTSAIFYGVLDTQTLGGAGFASQSTTGRDRLWDLSPYDGILLEIAAADGKRYTLTLKDKIMPKDPETGHVPAGISYESVFYAAPRGDTTATTTPIFLPWSSFLPTYRGRAMKGAPRLDKTHVKQMSLMMRSFFDTQHGPFALTIVSICAVSVPPSKRPFPEYQFRSTPAGSGQRQDAPPPTLEEKGAAVAAQAEAEAEAEASNSPSVLSRLWDALAECTVM